jgi:GNAT superfamily N-acetyltransferase
MSAALSMPTQITRRATDIEVTPVRSWRDRREFMNLAWRLYEGDPNWVPPLRLNFKQLVGLKHHPFQKIGEVQTFLARRRGEVVGRIAGIVDHEHNRVHKDHRGFWGFFESIDDQDVANALFDAVVHWLADRNITLLRGPANPSLNYEAGLLIQGFDSPPTFMMTYNPPYYERLVEGYGFQKVHDLYAYMGYLHQLPEAVKKLAHMYEAVRERFNVKVRAMDKKHFKRDVNLFLEMWNRAGVANWGFVPLTAGEVKEHSKALKHFLIPELCLAAEADGHMCGVVLGLPDFNPIVKQIDGKLFPFGFLKLLRGKTRLKRARLLSIAVVPEYQRWGVGLVLMASMLPKGIALGMEEVEFSWIVESNTMARGGLEKGGAKIFKTYRMYDLDAGPKGAERS